METIYKDRFAKYRALHLEECRKRDREFKKQARIANPEAVRLAAREYRNKNLEKKRAASRKYWAENRPRMLATLKKSYQKNKAKRAGAWKRWAIKNRDRYNAQQREKRKNNPQFAIGMSLRGRINNALRNFGLKRDASLEDLLGCTVGQLMQQLESQFTAGMGWHNRKLWHIDHIIPCAAFDLTKPEQRATCFHHSNLQPLWAAENIRKGKKLKTGTMVASKFKA